MKKIIDHIIKNKIKYLAIIGLAKNAGKTVAFNQIIKEAQIDGLRLGLLSYGRDGEEIDVITLKKKPRILIPPGTVFATAKGALDKSTVKADLQARTDLDTLLGKVNIYRSGSKEGFIELVGINTARKFKKIQSLFPDELDLIVIDGALDRKSSAMPELTEGVVMSTGAVIGNTEELVINRSILEYDKLTLPGLEYSFLKDAAHRAYQKDVGAVVKKDGHIIFLHSKTTFDTIDEIRHINPSSIEALVIKGALIDSFTEKLFYSIKLRDCKVIVRDGTRIFLNKRNLNLMNYYRLELKALKKINLLAVTVNPVSPEGIELDSYKIISGLQKKISVPVYDLMSTEYEDIFLERV